MMVSDYKKLLSITVFAIFSVSVLQIFLIPYDFIENQFISFAAVTQPSFKLSPSNLTENDTTLWHRHQPLAKFLPKEEDDKYDPNIDSAVNAVNQSSTHPPRPPLDGDRQQRNTSQFLSRQNVSRNLCGAVLNASTKATHLPPILSTSQTKHPCRRNAITYLVQKRKQSKYRHVSMAQLLKSLDLLYKNYLSINNHYDNVDLLLVHTGDFSKDDLHFLDKRYKHKVHFKVIDLNNTDFWTIPDVVKHDNISLWIGPLFGVGYRHMIRWYALKLYDFLRDFGATTNGCRYQYLMRLDDDSFIFSPIQYDLFDFMQSHSYSFAYRICSFETDVGVWNDYTDHVQHCDGSLPAGIPYHQLAPHLCGFYNNFCIVNVDFMLQPNVQRFLQWTDATGIMYRERYGDLQIQTIAVYAFSPPERIHRFLDWTYEHFSLRGGCPVWGALQAGYLDQNVNSSFDGFQKVYFDRCRRRRYVNHTLMNHVDLSPTHSHLPNSSWFEENVHVPLAKFSWRTFQAGRAEIIGDSSGSSQKIS